MKLSILNIDYHRNGVAGEPFHAIVFRDTGPQCSVKVAVVFQQPGYCAVLDIAMLVDCDVEFGSNSWRGDQYEPGLRKAIAKSLRETETLGSKK